MKKAIIVIWIGKMPNYFKLWEYSCSKNYDYDFFIFTDQFQKSNYKNVLFIDFSLDKFNEIASKKLNMNIKVNKPYKLCDFRPAYGLIFEDYLKDYDFWGHCDMDLVFGIIRNFVTEEVLNRYDKINKNGHFVLYRNTLKMNNLFKEKGSIFNYIDVFNSNENFAFDEYTGINMIVEKQKIRFFYINDFADIDKEFKRYICKNQENYKYQMYKYYEGKIFKVFYDNKIKEKEMMYLHFQKKKPEINFKYIDSCIAIGYKTFCNIDYKVNNNVIKNVNGCENKIINFFERVFYHFIKLNEFLFSSNEKRKIWLRQKKSKEEYK